MSFGLFESTGTTKRGRDQRRAFTQTQKKEILHQQDYKCAKCHKKLDLRATQFDHKKPWAARGRTVVVNGRAVDSNCHSVITHARRLKKVEKGVGKRQSKKQVGPFDEIYRIQPPSLW